MIIWAAQIVVNGLLEREKEDMKLGDSGKVGMDLGGVKGGAQGKCDQMHYIKFSKNTNIIFKTLIMNITFPYVWERKIVFIPLLFQEKSLIEVYIHY